MTLAGGEIYQAIERGVVDGSEYSTPGIDFNAGFAEVTDFWLTPGWHQSASIYGVMINKDSWARLSPNTQEKLKLAAQATMAWSLSWVERGSNEGTKNFLDAGIEINRLSDDELEKIQRVANTVVENAACEDKLYARIYHSMVSYLEDYDTWRDVSAPFNMTRDISDLPDLSKFESCM